MLLGFTRTHERRPAQTPAHHPLPATATDHGARMWFEAFGMQFMRENWSLLLNVLLGVALVVMGLLAVRLADRASRAPSAPFLRE